jgi:hypothetical protein
MMMLTSLQAMKESRINIQKMMALFIPFIAMRRSLKISSIVKKYGNMKKKILLKSLAK